MPGAALRLHEPTPWLPALRKRAARERLAGPAAESRAVCTGYAGRPDRALAVEHRHFEAARRAAAPIDVKSRRLRRPLQGSRKPGGYAGLAAVFRVAQPLFSGTSP
jgi:hypothetical protein